VPTENKTTKETKTMNDAIPSTMIGDLSQLAALARTATLLGVVSQYGGRHYVLRFGEGPSVAHQNKRRAMYAEMDRVRRLGGRADEVLCRFQTSGQARYRYTISTNIYGWAAGCMLKTNLGGGRFADTRRGATFLECVSYCKDRAEGRGADFTLSLVPDKHLPVEVCVLMAIAAGASKEDVAWIEATEERRLAEAKAKEEALAEAKALQERRATFRTALRARLVSLGLALEEDDRPGYRFQTNVRIPLVGHGALSVAISSEGEAVLRYRVKGQRRPLATALEVDGPLTVGNVARAVWAARAGA
jgi:hypothetical protein